MKLTIDNDQAPSTKGLFGHWIHKWTKWETIERGIKAAKPKFDTYDHVDLVVYVPDGQPVPDGLKSIGLYELQRSECTVCGKPKWATRHATRQLCIG